MTEPTREGAEGVELRQQMARLIGGYQISAAIGAVARLGVADALAAGPMGPQELAARVGADARSLGRTLRALEDAGLFTKLDDGRIALTALGELLRSDVPASARRGAIASTEEWRWRAYGHLTHSVRTGEPGFALAHGCGLWEYLAREPDAAAMFNESMSRVAAANAAALVRTYDFSNVTGSSTSAEVTASSRPPSSKPTRICTASSSICQASSTAPALACQRPV